MASTSEVSTSGTASSRESSDEASDWFLDPPRKIQIEAVSVRDPWLKHRDLDVIVKSGVLEGEARVIDLVDHERALVWIDSRFTVALGPDLYALWTEFHDVMVEIVDARRARLEQMVKSRDAAIGIEVLSLGIRDRFLPGEMKDLMNKVSEAKKASEASLITRREETAAMRSQANTAKILESNPTLMRLRELEVLERVAEKANLNVILGEKGLADRVVKLL